MIFGKVQYNGPGKYYTHFYNDRSVTFETCKEFRQLPLEECYKLIKKGHFIPDKETVNRLMEQGELETAEKVSGLLTGKKVFIVGSGRSLKGFDHNRFKKEFTIVLNHSVKDCPDADAMLFIDEVMWKQAQTEIKNYRGMIFCAYRTGWKHKDFRSSTFEFAINKGEPQTDYNLGLYSGSLSGLAALNLAIIMDASKIYLFGFDMKPPTKEYLEANDGNVHSYNDEGLNNRKNYLNQEWCDAKIEMFKKFLPWKDRIICCTPDSGLDFFEYIPMEEVV